MYGALLRSGIWSNVARTRIHEQGTEVFRFYVEALPYQKNVRKPGAWLVKFIGERSPLAIEPPWRRLQEAEAAPVEPTASLCSAATQHDEPALHEPHRKANSLWQDVVKCVGDRIDVSSLRVWFECTMAVGLETYALVVAVPNGLRRGIHRDQVQGHPRRGAAFPPFPHCGDLPRHRQGRAE